MAATWPTMTLVTTPLFRRADRGLHVSQPGLAFHVQVLRNRGLRVRPLVGQALALLSHLDHQFLKVRAGRGNAEGRARVAVDQHLHHPELALEVTRCFLLFGHLCRLFLGPGFWLAARWNRLGETVKTRKERGKTGENGRDTV